MSLKKNCYLLSILMIFMCFPVFARSGERYIAVKEIKAKSSPGIWGSESGVFFYGDKVQVIDEKKSWIKVLKDGKSGWIKDTCVTSRKIRADGQVSVNADEIALAGKGFSNSLEAEYSDSYNIDFDVVDSIEKIQLSDNELRNFIVNGNLNGAQ